MAAVAVATDVEKEAVAVRVAEVAMEVVMMAAVMRAATAAAMAVAMAVAAVVTHRLTFLAQGMAVEVEKVIATVAALAVPVVAPARPGRALESLKL